MTVIGTNISALRAANASNSASMSLQTSMERLSTGKRINSAADDAAGLAISTSMTSQIRGMTQGIRNANDGIALAQTADGALQEATNILQRMRELAVQSSSGTYQGSDRTNMQTEVTELQKQLSTIMGTEFNGVALFDSSADKSVNIQTGADATDQVALTIKKLDMSTVSGTVADATTSASLGDALLAGDPLVDSTHKVTAEDVAYGAKFGGTTAVAADIGTNKVLAAGDQIAVEATTAGSVTGGIDVSTDASAKAALDTLDDALDALNATRASIGAGQSRLQSSVNSMTTNISNLTDARSRIEDTDFSAETTNLAKAQILSQASTAMLAQANQSQQGVLKLLQ
jgi:flagellin